MSHNPSPTYPRNPLTDIMEHASALNAEHPRARSVVGEGPRAASSASLGPVPLSAEEKAHRDQRARELGILPEDEGEPGNPAVAEATRAALEARLRASAPAQAVPEPVTLSNRRSLLNFGKIEMIDLTVGVIRVDGMDVPLTQESLTEVRAWTLGALLRAVTDQMGRAAAEMGIAPEQLSVEGMGGDEGLSAVRGNEATE